jgi:hypothetical protein
MSLSRSVVDLAVIAGNEFIPLDLARILQAIDGEVGQVSVIRDDLDGMSGAFQNGVPFFEGLDDYEKSYVIHLIIRLG